MRARSRHDRDARAAAKKYEDEFGVSNVDDAGLTGYRTLALPSTSPAYTRPLAEKIEAWRALARWIA